MGRDKRRRDADGQGRNDGAKQERKRRRPRAIGWQGLMEHQSKRIRSVALALLWILSAALSFTQLGFAGIGFDGSYSAYMVVLLAPITLSAILLGPKSSTLTGLFAGAVALLHAKLMPLDYYEFTFVNVYSSVVAMLLMGLLLGLMFAVAFRGDGPRWRKFLYVALICMAASWMYNILFTVNIFVSVIGYMLSIMEDFGSTEFSAELQAQALSMTARTGNLSLQSWANALNMMVAAYIALAVHYKVGPASRRRSIRFVFNASLAAVAFAAFCLTSALCFVSISTVEFIRGSVQADGEIEYIADQLDAGQDRAMALEAVMERFAADEDGYGMMEDETLVRQLNTMLSQDSILEGYDPKADGYVFIGDIDNNYVRLSDVELEMGEDGTYPAMDELLNTDVLEAAKRSIETGDIVKTVYDHAYADLVRGAKEAEDAEDGMTDSLEEVNERKGFTSELMYLLAISNVESDDDIIMMVTSERVYPTRDVTMTAVSVAFGSLMALVFVVVAKLSNNLIVSRIRKINGTLTEVVDGNLDARSTVDDTLEFAELSDHVNTTVDALRGLIDEAKKQNEQDMATAKAIQESAIPMTFPPFPDNHHFDIYATMNAAKDVGGDFYDFFMLGDESDGESGRLAFVMADVSGKGIPASLFMMKAKTQIRDYLSSGMEISEALENANHQLCEGNSVGMFVTVWVGILDYATGHVDFVNAGHNPPLVWRHKGSKWSWLTPKSGLPLGMFDGLSYKAHSIDLLPGEMLFLYTDGVNEAFNVDEEEYGNDRLEGLLNEHLVEHPREICGIVRRSVAEFAAGAEQSDDITMMALEYGVPPEVTATLVVRADVSQLDAVNEFIHTELDRRLCPMRVQNQIDIAVEELFVNICNYAYADAPDAHGMVRVSYTYSSEPPSVIIGLADEGVPYNPMEKPDAVTPQDIMAVPVGGLGILLAKKNVNSMEYERSGDTNILTITKSW